MSQLAATATGNKDQESKNDDVSVDDEADVIDLFYDPSEITNDSADDTDDPVDKTNDLREATSGTLNDNLAVDDVGTPVGSAPSDSDAPLTDTEMYLLRKEMMDNFAAAETSLSEQDLSAKVQAALPMAMSQKRAYDKTVTTFKNSV